MKSNAYTILVGIALVVLPYFLTQSDVVVPPLLKVTLQAAILAVGVIARYLPSDTEPTKVQISGTVATTPAETSSQPAQDVKVDG